MAQQLSVPLGITSAAWRFFVQGHPLSQGVLHPMTDSWQVLRSGYVGPTWTTLQGHSSSRTLCEGHQGGHWARAASQLLPLPNPTPSPSLGVSPKSVCLNLPAD